MTDTPHASAVTVVTPSAPTRWTTIVPVIIGIITTVIMLGGFMLTIGSWRATVDLQIADLNRRVGKAEANQEKYIPILVGMTKDLSYLADRARREDERTERDTTRH